LKATPVDRENFLHVLVSKVKELATELNETPTRIQFTESGVSDYQIRLAGGYEKILALAGLELKSRKKMPPPIPKSAGPKVLIFDIETSPMELYGYGLFDQNFSLAQIKEDWYVLSWAAKWLGSPEEEVIYRDVRENENLKDDYGIISQIWQMLDEADIVITQNGIRFDQKKLMARFIKHGFPRPSSFRHVDTLRIAKRHFGFTSNKLEFMTNFLNKKYKKLTHAEFAGFDLWRACLEKNPAAWECMEKYNRYDVLALEELYLNLRPYDNTINFNVYHDGLENYCSCGTEKELEFNGYDYTNIQKRPKFTCVDCGAEWISRYNELSKEKRRSLLR
jgi:DNA polymerase elongation subunit (family B)